MHWMAAAAQEDLNRLHGVLLGVKVEVPPEQQAAALQLRKLVSQPGPPLQCDAVQPWRKFPIRTRHALPGC